jgi:hypothetical protein
MPILASPNPEADEQQEHRAEGSVARAVLSIPHTLTTIVGVRMGCDLPQLGARFKSICAGLSGRFGSKARLSRQRLDPGCLGHYSSAPRRSGNSSSGCASRLPHLKHCARKRIGSSWLSTNATMAATLATSEAARTSFFVWCWRPWPQSASTPPIRG